MRSLHRVTALHCDMGSEHKLTILPENNKEVAELVRTTSSGQAAALEAQTHSTDVVKQSRAKPEPRVRKWWREQRRKQKEYFGVRSLVLTERGGAAR